MALLGEIDKKFPEFNELWIRYEDGHAIQVPHFLRLIVSAALNDGGPSCAFIIPQPQTVAYLTALFTGLLDTKKHFLERRESFARSGLQPGQNVQLLPSGEVYEYDGVREYAFRANPNKKSAPPSPELRFSLKLLGVKSNNGTISQPISEVLRLLPTERMQPYGRGQTSKEKIALSDLDKVLMIESFGNSSVFSNKVIVHSNKQQIESFLSCWDIYNPIQKAALKDLTDFPWGVINSDGVLIPSDRYQVCGEPIIALSNRLSPIDGYCSDQIEKTKVVIAFNRKTILKESYDAGNIAEKQKVILITDHLDDSECEAIENQNIAIWKLEEDEVFMGIDKNHAIKDAGYPAPIRKIFIAAGSISESIVAKVVESNVFQDLCDGISLLQDEIDDKDTRESILSNFQRVLWRSSELLSLPGREYQDWLLAQVVDIEKSLKNHSAFLRKDLADSADAMAVLIMNELLPDIEKHSEEKLILIKDFIDMKQAGKILILARHEEAVLALQRRLQPVRPDVTFLTYSELSSFNSLEGAIFETAIIIGWPGKHLFLNLLQSGIANSIKAVLYSHENKIMNRFFKQRKNSAGKLNPLPEKKEEISGLPSSFFLSDPNSGPEEAAPPEVYSDNSQNISKIKTLEDILDVSWSVRPPSDLIFSADGIKPVKAKLISLSNDMCLYLSEDQHISVISPANHEYKRKTSDELALGDIIVFRGGSEKELLREVATSIYGDSYDKLWIVATLWKIWLRSLGSGPNEIWQKLVSAGLNRHPVTISQWLNYDDRIGPQNLNDILVIAQATENEANIKDSARVAEAIKQIRGVHIEAGFKLTAVVMRDLAKNNAAASNENGDLSRKLSDVRLYTVEDIDDEPQDVSPHLVNSPRSLWSFNQDRVLDELLKDIANG